MAVNKVVINGTDGETVLIDLTEDTVTPETLLSGVKAHGKDGNVVEGTIPIIESEQIGMGQSASTHSGGYTIPEGYHDGTGTVKVAAVERTVTPSKNTQTLPGTLPVYLSKVTVNPIPDEYQDVRNVTATEDGVELGKVFVDATGAEKTGTFTITNEITEQDSLIAQIRTALAGKTAGGGSEVPMQEKTVSITENGTHEIVPDAGYTLSKAVVNVNVAASGGASEYYTITNNTGLDLVICDHVVTAGTTVDIPVDVNAMREMGGYLLVHSWLDNVITPTKTYIVATVNGSVPTQSPKNRINRIAFYVGPQSYAAFMAGVDIATLSGSTFVQPASGSTIVLTLSA